MIITLKSSDVRRCPAHVLRPDHYNTDGSCKCAEAAALTLRQKEIQAVNFHDCPVCESRAGFKCLNQNATRVIHPLKRPHAERLQLVDPSLAGYRPRRNIITAAGWQQSDSRNKS